LYQTCLNFVSTLIHSRYKIDTKTIRSWYKVRTELLSSWYRVDNISSQPRYKVDAKSIQKWNWVGTELIQSLYSLYTLFINLGNSCNKVDTEMTKSGHKVVTKLKQLALISCQPCYIVVIKLTKGWHTNDKYTEINTICSSFCKFWNKVLRKLIQNLYKLYQLCINLITTLYQLRSHVSLTL
jgi:hypothetical protein